MHKPGSRNILIALGTQHTGPSVIRLVTYSYFERHLQPNNFHGIRWSNVTNLLVRMPVDFRGPESSALINLFLAFAHHMTELSGSCICPFPCPEARYHPF
jgi:hypothetical protein